MANEHDIVIRDAYLADRDTSVDVAIDGEEISAVRASISGAGDEEIDAAENLLVPGFVDSHLHMDKAYSASGDRLPKYNDGQGFSVQRIVADGLAYYKRTSADEIEDNAVELGQKAVENGTLFIRSHVNVGPEIGTKAMEAILAARERLSDIVDIQIVALPVAGILDDETRELVHESLEMGADLLGGIDPATTNNDVERTIETWFEVADRHDVELDPHLHDPGTLGMYELTRLARKTVAHGYEGRVTASHAFALADVAGRERNLDKPGLVHGELKAFEEGELRSAMPVLKEAAMKFTCCHPSSRPGMPIAELLDEDLPVGWGSDNVSDWVIRHAQPDPLQGALVNAFKLDYNMYTFASNPGLDILWRMITTEGANVLGLEEYGIAVGNPANLVLLDEPSPQWAIINQATRQYVIKRGSVVARGGELSDLA